MECLSYCIADTIDLTKLDNHYKTTLAGYSSVKSRDVLKLSPSDASGILVFVFKNGTVVSWGIKRHHVNAYIDTILKFANKPLATRTHDEFIYRAGNKTAIEPHDYFDVDCLSIETDSDELKLSLSYGFSQSVKLQYFEAILENLIEQYSPLIRGLSKKFGLSAKRAQISQVIGEILGAKSEMNLISNFLYHPKYFWQHPTLEEYFIMLERYLHIQRRINAINHRLDTLNEIFNMFNDYLESSRSHSLEVTIVVLITIEIIMGVLHFYY